MSDQVKYFLRPGDTAFCEADVQLSKNYEFIPYNMNNMRVELMNYGDGYKVQYPDGCPNRPYIMADRDELIEYAKMIISGYEHAADGGADCSKSMDYPVTCDACKEDFPFYWTKDEPLCAFCNNPHGVSQVMMRSDDETS